MGNYYISDEGNQSIYLYQATEPIARPYI